MTRPPRRKILLARCYFGWKTRRWPWQVPWQVVYIGRERPPQHVIDYFRRLHGMDDAPHDRGAA